MDSKLIWEKLSTEELRTLREGDLLSTYGDEEADKELDRREKADAEAAKSLDWSRYTDSQLEGIARYDLKSAFRVEAQKELERRLAPKPKADPGAEPWQDKTQPSDSELHRLAEKAWKQLLPMSVEVNNVDANFAGKIAYEAYRFAEEFLKAKKNHKG